MKIISYFYFINGLWIQASMMPYLCMCRSVILWPSIAERMWVCARDYTPEKTYQRKRFCRCKSVEFFQILKNHFSWVPTLLFWEMNHLYHRIAYFTKVMYVLYVPTCVLHLLCADSTEASSLSFSTLSSRYVYTYTHTYVCWIVSSSSPINEKVIHTIARHTRITFFFIIINQ